MGRKHKRSSHSQRRESAGVSGASPAKPQHAKKHVQPVVAAAAMAPAAPAAELAHPTHAEPVEAPVASVAEQVAEAVIADEPVAAPVLAEEAPADADAPAAHVNAPVAAGGVASRFTYSLLGGARSLYDAYTPNAVKSRLDPLEARLMKSASVHAVSSMGESLLGKLDTTLETQVLPRVEPAVAAVTHVRGAVETRVLEPAHSAVESTRSLVQSAVITPARLQRDALVDTLRTRKESLVTQLDQSVVAPARELVTARVVAPVQAHVVTPMLSTTRAVQDAVEERVGSTKRAVEERVGSTKRAVEERVGSTKRAVEERVGSTKRAVRDAVEERMGSTKRAVAGAVEERVVAPLTHVYTSGREVVAQRVLAPGRALVESAMPPLNQMVEKGRAFVEARAPVVSRVLPLLRTRQAVDAVLSPVHVHQAEGPSVPGVSLLSLSFTTPLLLVFIGDVAAPAAHSVLGHLARDMPFISKQGVRVVVVYRNSDADNVDQREVFCEQAVGDVLRVCDDDGALASALCNAIAPVRVVDVNEAVRSVHAVLTHVPVVRALLPDAPAPSVAQTLFLVRDGDIVQAVGTDGAEAVDYYAYCLMLLENNEEGETE